MEKRRADLVEIRPNTAKLVVQIASELGCRRLKNKPISGNIWRVGAVETLAGELVIYFQPTLRSGQDLIDLENALAHEVRGRFGIVLTAERGLSHPPLKTIAIEDCLGFDPSACVFTFEADLLTLSVLRSFCPVSCCFEVVSAFGRGEEIADLGLLPDRQHQRSGRRACADAPLVLKRPFLSG